MKLALLHLLIMFFNEHVCATGCKIIFSQSLSVFHHQEYQRVSDFIKVTSIFHCCLKPLALCTVQFIDLVK